MSELHREVFSGLAAAAPATNLRVARRGLQNRAALCEERLSPQSTGHGMHGGIRDGTDARRTQDKATGAGEVRSAATGGRRVHENEARSRS